MPETPDRDALLRREVGLLRRRESRRVFDTRLYVGSLGGEHESAVVRAQDLPVVDAALRADLMSALVGSALADGLGCTVWLSRAGTPDAYDLDLCWLTAAATACSEHGTGLDGFYVITRAGWLDPRSGRRRTWKRLRL